jgi:Phosphatidylglycerol lysyltransferase, C-terminal
MLSLPQSDSDTMASRRLKIRKKARKPTAPAPEKLFETLGSALIDKMICHPNCNNSPDLFQILVLGNSKFQSPPTTNTTTSMNSSTTTVAIITTNDQQKESLCLNALKAKNTKRKDVTINHKYKKSGNVFTLDDFSAMAALESLYTRYGKVQHMGILDKAYSFFITKQRDAALYFKVTDKIAIVGGDPLCDPSKYDAVLNDFAGYCKQFGWGIAFLGVTNDFADHARSKKWVVMQFGVERVLNPMTNPVLLETGNGGRRIISQNRQLLRKGITLDVYCPSYAHDPALQDELVDIYETWRSHRNELHTVQAYLTVYDPFALPELMTYIYAKDADGKLCGFAALRRVVDGYHIDPCIARTGAPRGISELLIFAAMSLLNKAGVSYLSLGFEPSLELGTISGMSKPLQSITRAAHRRTYRTLPIGGKKEFHDKFRPDETQQADLYIIFPGTPGVRHVKAMMHVVNINISRLIAEEFRRPFLSSIEKYTKRDRLGECKQPMGGEERDTA